MNDLTGQNLKGYVLKDRIGAGGFGAVYLAVQSTVGREVAVKVILPGLANQPDFIRRFESEAQIIARLEHMHITPLYDYWRDPEGAYIVMRYLRGGSLREMIDQNRLDVETVAHLLDQIGSALEVAHRNQVIHRDIKPSNILLDEDGNAYLADFGIAKDIGGGAETMTEANALIGSPDYLSPEQARSEAVTPQTDIYSLGVVLYEMLVGEHPFPGLTLIERLYKHINEPLPELNGLDIDRLDKINAVVQKATAKDPRQRYKSVLVLAQAFRSSAGLMGSSTPANQVVELLTPREQEILSLLMDGLSNREIAGNLVIEIATVKWYTNKIYKKLGVRSRVQAIVKAKDLNLLFDRGVKDKEFSTSYWSSLPEPENPYKGLRAFQTADVQDFFGREKLTQRLLDKLLEQVDYSRFLAVIGPSGSGKSSLVKAGVIPALWRGDLPGSDKWFITEMIPGAHPLDELEIALTQVSTRKTEALREHLERDKRGLVRATQLVLPDEEESELCLIIDQFEEIFTLVEDEAARNHFLNLIYTAITDPRSRVRVLVTLRADFYDRPLQHPQFGELVRSRMETVLPLSSSELERVISGPAGRVGVRFEEGLVAAIVDDVHYQPGALPLLQYEIGRAHV